MISGMKMLLEDAIDVLCFRNMFLSVSKIVHIDLVHVAHERSIKKRSIDEHISSGIQLYMCLLVFA